MGVIFFVGVVCVLEFYVQFVDVFWFFFGGGDLFLYFWYGYDVFGIGGVDGIEFDVIGYEVCYYRCIYGIGYGVLFVEQEGFVVFGQIFFLDGGDVYDVGFGVGLYFEVGEVVFEVYWQCCVQG